VTVAQVQAQFHISNTMALGALEKMRGHGECQREQRTDRDVYLFKSVMPAKVIRRCPYCGGTFAVKSALRECPNCGAALDVIKE
jgi:rubrerythrin